LQKTYFEADIAVILQWRQINVKKEKQKQQNSSFLQNLDSRSPKAIRAVFVFVFRLLDPQEEVEIRHHGVPAH